MKIVIYTQRVEIIESYKERRDCADQRIADFIEKCGFLPVPIPNKCDMAENFIKELHPAGIILTGGNSLVVYGGEAPERDAMDKALISLAIAYKIPLYGFCRGMQSILSYFRNELESVEGHVAVHHLVIGEEVYEENSYHNQGCKRLKKDCGLVVTGRSEDGVIEAVRHEHYSIMASMWHPEREYPFSQRDISRITKLFQNAI